MSDRQPCGQSLAAESTIRPSPIANRPQDAIRDDILPYLWNQRLAHIFWRGGRCTQECARHSKKSEVTNIYKGMLPCFFLGELSTLFLSIRKARMILGRVSCGSITSSMNPRSAATNGFANRSRNSSTFWR
jgi:hypothetical protein